MGKQEWGSLAVYLFQRWTVDAEDYFVYMYFVSEVQVSVFP